MYKECNNILFERLTAASYYRLPYKHCDVSNSICTTIYIEAKKNIFKKYIINIKNLSQSIILGVEANPNKIYFTFRFCTINKANFQFHELLLPLEYDKYL